MAERTLVAWFDAIFPRRALFQADRRLLHLTVGRMLGSMGFAITIPFLSLYLHSERGIAMTAVGGMFFLAALAGALSQFLGGDWADRYGRKIILVVAQAGRGVIFLGLGLAVYFDSPLYVFALLTCGSGFFGRLFDPPSGAMIADIASGEERAEGYGVLRIGGNLGWALGPALGGFLAALSYASLFLVSAGVMFVSAALVAAKVRETAPWLAPGAAAVPGGTRAPGGATGAVPPAQERFRLSDAAVALRDPLFLRYCIILLVFFTAMAQLMSTISIYVVDWAGHSKAELGFLYSLNGLLVVFLQIPVTRAMAPLRMTTQLVIGCLLYSAGYAMMGFGGAFPLLFAAMFVITIGEIVASPPSMNMAAGFSSEAMRGRYMGTYGLFSSFGWSLGPLVGGVLLDLTRGRAPLLWGLVALIALPAAAGFWDLRRRISPAMDRSLEDTR